MIYLLFERSYRSKEFRRCTVKYGTLMVHGCCILARATFNYRTM